MSTPAVGLGPEAVVLIGGAGALVNAVGWGVIEGSYRDTGDSADTTDTFNAGNKHSKTGLTVFSADITMQKMKDVVEDLMPLGPGGGVTAGAYGLMVGNFISVQIYPYGTSFAAYTCPFFRIASWEGNFRVKGSEPQTLRISGESSGNYYTPSGQRGGALLGVMPATTTDGP